MAENQLLYSTVIPYRDCTEPTLQGEPSCRAFTSLWDRSCTVPVQDDSGVSREIFTANAITGQSASNSQP